MPAFVTSSDMQLFKTATPPVSEETADIGGSCSTTRIYGTDPGEVHFTSYATAVGGGNKVQTSKFHSKNTNSLYTAQGVQYWGPNFGLDLPSAGMPRFVSTSPLDNSLKMVRWMGFDNTVSLAPQQGENTCNGTTSVSALDIYSFISRATLHDANSGALAVAAGTISFYIGDTLWATMPPGYSTIVCEIDMGTSTTLNDSVTIATSLIAPPVPVSRCRSQATCITVPGGTLVAGASCAIWSRWTLRERARPSAFIEALIRTRILAS